MAKYTRRDLEDMVETDGADSFYEEFVHNTPGYVVCHKDQLPFSVRRAFPFNGGDENWYVFVRKEAVTSAWMPFWLEHTDTCFDPDVYDMGGYYVYVGSHS